MKKIKKKFLVLGSNFYQESLIKDLIENNHEVSVASNKIIKSNLKINKFHKVSVSNNKKILKIFKENKYDEIISTGSDIVLKSIAYINSKLKLNGLKLRDYGIISNKQKMKKFFIKNNINTPKIINLNYLKNTSQKKFKPVILKEIDNSGSRNIFKINNKKKLLSIKNKKIIKSKYILEELIEGTEFGVNVIFYNKQIVKIMIFEDLLFDNGKTNVPIGHIYPIKKLYKYKKKIASITRKIIDNLNLTQGFLNLDFILDKKKNIFLLEFSIRFGATGIPEILKYTYNIDIFNLSLNSENIAYYKKILNLKNNNFYLSYLPFSNTKGILKKIAVKNAGIKNLKYCNFIKINQDVKKFNTGNHGLGIAVFEFSNYEHINKDYNHYFDIKIKK